MYVGDCLFMCVCVVAVSLSLCSLLSLFHTPLLSPLFSSPLLPSLTLSYLLFSLRYSLLLSYLLFSLQSSLLRLPSYLLSLTSLPFPSLLFSKQLDNCRPSFISTIITEFKYFKYTYCKSDDVSDNLYNNSSCLLWWVLGRRMFL